MPEGENTSAWRRIKQTDCPHLVALKPGITPTKSRCEQCGLTDNLRICLSCGYVGCCESRGAHDTEHFRGTGHPFIKPHNAGADWLWCYECNAFLE